MASLPAWRDGRCTSTPPQLGHFPFSVPSAQAAQKVHSKEQIRASVPDGSRSVSQHSQLGRISSMPQVIAHRVIHNRPTGRRSLEYLQAR